MPQPTLGSVHVNKALSNMAVGYRNRKLVLSGPMGVFPSISVVFESDDYYVWGKGAIFANRAAERAPGTRAKRGGYDVTTASYRTTEKAFAWPIPDRVRNNMDAAIRPEIRATSRTMDTILLYKEIEIATLLTTASNWGDGAGSGDGDPSVKWDVYATSVPMFDVEDASEIIRKAIGASANTGVLEREWALKAMRSAQLRDLIRYTGQPLGSLASFEVLRQAFKLERLVICEAIYNTANLGQAASMSPVMTDAMWVGYVADSPGLDEPSAGYTFQSRPPRVRSFREEAEEQEVVEASVVDQTKVTAPYAGYVITNLAT